MRSLSTIALLSFLSACSTHQPVLAEPPVPAMVTEAAVRHGVPARLAHAVAKAESSYRCNARGLAGEQGVMQVKPATARSVGVTGNLFNCRTGIEAGMRYLKQALVLSGGNWCGAATLYNRGIGARPTRSAYCTRLALR